MRKTFPILALAFCSALILGVTGCDGEVATTTALSATTSIAPTTTTTEGPPTWTDLKPAGESPEPRCGHAMTYSPVTGRLILFGGTFEGSAGDTYFNDTWAYDPAVNAWTALNPTGLLPDGRGGPPMVYSEASDRVILFGGSAENTYFNDTWAYDPVVNAWTNLAPTGDTPSGRWGACMVSDEAGGKVLLFGGGTGDLRFLNDTWAYDPAVNAWTALHPTGVLPDGRGGASMVYDNANGRVILFGGMTGEFDYFNDTWAYDPSANSWTDLAPAGDVPSARWAACMAYDRASGKVILFGGMSRSGYLSDTWAYDPAVNAWTRLDPAGDVPSGRTFPWMAYEPARGKVILFGGRGEAGHYFDDTWAYGVNP